MMTNEFETKAHALMAEMQCSRKFACVRDGVVRRCKTRNSGLVGHPDCTSDKSYGCRKTLRFGLSTFCRCPLQVLLAAQPAEAIPEDGDTQPFDCGLCVGRAVGV